MPWGAYRPPYDHEQHMAIGWVDTWMRHKVCGPNPDFESDYVTGDLTASGLHFLLANFKTWLPYSGWSVRTWLPI